MVAVPSDQHSPTLGQRASSQTVWRSSSRNVCFSWLNVSPPGARTLSQAGLGEKRDPGPDDEEEELTPVT